MADVVPLEEYLRDDCGDWYAEDDGASLYTQETPTPGPSPRPNRQRTANGRAMKLDRVQNAIDLGQLTV